jgi:hypothetical protein
VCACSNSDKDKDDLSDLIVEDIEITFETMENGDTFHFESIDSETVRITKFEGKDTPHAVTIPGTLNGKTVAEIGNSAFYYCSQVTTITFPASVTVIGDFAFAGCTALTELTIPATVKSIGVAAFYDCASLASVTFPAESELTTIAQHTFTRCAALTEIAIPAYIKTIDTAAFLGCSDLATVAIAEGCTAIGAQAFQNCTALKSLTLPASVTSIGTYAFSGSENLYGDGVTCPADSVAAQFIAKMQLEPTAPEISDEDVTEGETGL